MLLMILMPLVLLTDRLRSTKILWRHSTFNSFIKLSFKFRANKTEKIEKILPEATLTPTFHHNDISNDTAHCNFKSISSYTHVTETRGFSPPLMIAKYPRQRAMQILWDSVRADCVFSAFASAPVTTAYYSLQITLSGVNAFVCCHF